MRKISQSNLPNGGYTLTNGSNYMLDGFQFDTEYNGGVLEKARLPEAKGLSNLPSGMIPQGSPLFSEIPSHTDNEGGVHLSEFIKDASEQHIPIVDHSWLAKESEADLRGVRNKKDVYDQMDSNFYEDSTLKELSNLWGQSTNGLGLIPNTNRKHPQITNPYNKPQAGQPGDDYREKIEKAMRRSAYGEPIKNVITDLKQELGQELSKKYAHVIESIVDEHGLHGKVYLKESAFPGIFNGKWDAQIKGRCASANYIIPKHKDCVFDYHLGRKVVGSVDWKNAFKEYATKLKTVGIKLGSGLDYKARLKQAFLSEPPSAVIPQSWFPIAEDLTKKYSSSVAHAKFANYVPTQEKVETFDQRQDKLLTDKFNSILDKHLKLGMVTKKEYQDILNTPNIHEKTAKLGKYASIKTDSGLYDGMGVNSKGMFEKKWQEIDPHFTTLEEREIQTLENKYATLSNNLVKLGMVSKNYLNQVNNLNVDLHKKQQLLFKQASKPAISSKYDENQGLNKNARSLNASLMRIDGKVETYEERELALRNKQANLKIEKLIQANLITKDMAMKIACGCSLPEEKVEKVLNFLSKTPVSNKQYDQPVFEQVNLLREAKNDFAEFQAQLLNKDQRDQIAIQTTLETRLNKLVSANLIDPEQLKKITAGIKDPQQKIAKIVNFLNQVEKKNYSDTQYTQHIETKKSSTKLASEPTVEKWVRQKMSEGSMGKELNVLLKARFANNVLEHYGDTIRNLRFAHEGLSGQAYVDASAYDTGNGVTGCEQGALIHRANTIPAVLKMSKCSTCVFANADGICQKYNKPLIDNVGQLGIEEPRNYQKESIRLANSSDAEKTANLFVNNYDPNEFNLTQDNDVNIDPEHEHTDELSGVLFGGLIF
jgi:hypothetical protein